MEIRTVLGGGHDTAGPATELTGGPNALNLWLLSSAMAKRFSVGNDVFGFALVPGRWSVWRTDGCFADRIREFRSDDQFRNELLGLDRARVESPIR